MKKATHLECQLKHNFLPRNYKEMYSTSYHRRAPLLYQGPRNCRRNVASGERVFDDERQTQETASSGRLTKGDADLLRFAAWAEIVESDLWTQYNELGGATKPNDGPLNVGNPPYKLALQNFDSDMPQYITDNNDDELSHAAFLNAYLNSHGAEPVNLDRFRSSHSSHSDRALGNDSPSF